MSTSPMWSKPRCAHAGGIASSTRRTGLQPLVEPGQHVLPGHHPSVRRAREALVVRRVERLGRRERDGRSGRGQRRPSSTATSRPTKAIVGEATGAGAMIPRVTDAATSPSAYADEEFCYLTTTGRRTGRPHTIEIWFAVDRGVVYMMAGGRERSRLGAQPHRASRRCDCRSASTTGTRERASSIREPKRTRGSARCCATSTRTASTTSSRGPAPRCPVALEVDSARRQTVDGRCASRSKT